jgi:hypothetical protein
MTLEDLQDRLLADPKVELRIRQECRQIVARLHVDAPMSKSARGYRILATGTGGTIEQAVAGLAWPEGRQ